MLGSTTANSAPSFGGFGSGVNSGNTNATGGPFGNASRPTSGGLFGTGSNASGNTNAQSTPFGTQKPGGLFGATNNSAAQGNGLFGSKPSGMFGATNNNLQAGGLLGNLGTSSVNQRGGLFGSGGNEQSTGSLLGPNASGQNQGSLFGASKPATGGLFGGNSSTNNTNAQGSSLFGSSGNKSTTGGLFGTSGTNPSSQGGGLFGSSSNNFSSQGGGLFGSNRQDTSTLKPGSQQELTAMTRVGDLPENIKRELQEFDNYINTQHLIATTLQQDLNKHDRLIKSIPQDINYLNTKLSSTRQALRFDSTRLQGLKEMNNEVMEDINKMMQLIVQLSTPGTDLSSSVQLNEYFIRKIKKYYELINSYELIVKEADEVINGLGKQCVENIGGLFTVIEVIKSQFQLFMELCETMAQLHNDVNRLSK